MTKIITFKLSKYPFITAPNNPVPLYFAFKFVY